MLVVWVVLLAHLAATFVWAAPGYLTGRPDGEPLSGTPATTGPHRALEAWMAPVFEQNWSLFAPSPLHVDYVLRVRGVSASGPGGALVPGPWTDATAVETRALTGHLLPSAAERPARRLAADTRAAYLALPDDARALVLRWPAQVSPGTASAVDARSGAAPGHGAGGVAPARGSPDPWSGLRAALLRAGAAPDAVARYLAADRALTAYATQVVRALPDRAEAVYVQAAVVRRPVPRHGTGERAPDSELTLGARPPLRLAGQDDAAFADAWWRLRGAGAQEAP